jgi:hypothetical protein
MEPNRGKQSIVAGKPSISRNFSKLGFSAASDNSGLRQVGSRAFWGKEFGSKRAPHPPRSFQKRIRKAKQPTLKTNELPNHFYAFPKGMFLMICKVTSYTPRELVKSFI